MKRKIALLIVALMLIVSLTGCDSRKEETTAPETTKPAATEPAEQEAEAPTSKVEDPTGPVETEEPEEVEIIDGYITGKEAFTEVLGGLIDLSQYNYSEFADDVTTKNLCKYILKNNDYAPNLDFKVTLEDSTQFTLPFMIPDIQNQGWMLDGESAGKSVDKNRIEGCTFENDAGKQFIAKAYNLGEETKTTEELPCYTFIVYPYRRNPDTDEIEAQACVDFSICETITNESTLEDIIAQLGMPSYAEFYSAYSKNSGEYVYSSVNLRFAQMKGSYNDSLEIHLSGDGNYIMNITYDRALP